MPFWKREEKKAPPPPEKKPAKEAEKPKAAPAPPAPRPSPKPAAERTPGEIVTDVHHALVEVGLTIEGTREVFRKRVEEEFGSLEAFVQEYKAEASKAVTGFIASWLGFQVPAQFTLDELLYAANQRLSSFGIQVSATNETRVKETQGLREATFALGDQKSVLQFQTPREVFSEINAMVKDRGVRFLELETWSEDYAFMLAKSPHWDKLAASPIVVVKAEETATDGECPQCGARAGEKWASCTGCGAAFG